MKILANKFHSLSLLRQLSLLLVAGMLVMMLLASLSSSWFVSRDTRDSFLSQGLSLTGMLAAQSQLALIYQSSENAKTAASALLAFPQVSQIVVENQQGQILFESVSASQQKQNITPTQPSINYSAQSLQSAALLGEDANFLYFAGPVYLLSDSKSTISPFEDEAPGRDKQLLGYVRLTLAKSALAELSSNLIWGSLVTLMLSMSLGLILIRRFTIKVTTPLMDLAQAMSQPKLGNPLPETSLWGSKEIVKINQCFNNMIRVLKHREAELCSARDEALQAARLRSEFTANVSHELRTPLNGILGMLHLIDEPRLDEEQKEYVDIARGSGEHLLNLINDILDFSKLSAGHMQLECKDFDLQKLLEDVLALQSHATPNHQLAFTCLFAPGTPRFVKSDPLRIRQLFNNLIGNSVKFTSQGEIRLEVSTENIVDSVNHYSIKLSDSGIGINAAALPHIFDAYTQSDGSITRRYGGTGLGLGICKQLVVLMGGFIEVSSVVEQGSQFTVRLPLKRSQMDDLIPREFSSLQAIILVDSEAYRINLISLLEQWGASFTVIKQLSQLREIGRQPECLAERVIFWDWPGATCAQFLARAKQTLNPALCVMQLVDQLPDQQHSLPAFVNYALLKPLRRHAVEEKIQQWQQSQKQQIEFNQQEFNQQEFKIDYQQTIWVLVAEDNLANQKVASASLAKLGVKVDLVFNGLDAVKACEQNDYQLVLMDCRMPIMNGFEATQAIRALNGKCANLPIIALTANASNADKDKCLESGMNDFIAKPFRLHELSQLIDKWLQKSNAGI